MRLKFVDMQHPGSVSFYIKNDSEFLAATLWLPTKSRQAGLVFCHGWGGGAQYDDLLERLAANGYFALRFQQRGYGESTGKSDLSLWARDMAAAASTLQNVAMTVWAAGQSTGGTIALVAAATHDCFAGAISIAPFSNLARIVTDNPNARSILERHFGALEEKHFRAADALSTVRGLRKPVLVIHGTEDQTVPFEHGRSLSEQLGDNSRFIRIDGGDHHLRDAREQVIKEVLVWLEGG